MSQGVISNFHLQPAAVDKISIPLPRRWDAFARKSGGIFIDSAYSQVRAFLGNKQILRDNWGDKVENLDVSIGVFGMFLDVAPPGLVRSLTHFHQHYGRIDDRERVSSSPLIGSHRISPSFV